MTGGGLHRGWRTKGKLPHFDMPGLYQFVTFRLADSLPKSSIVAIHRSAKGGGDAFTEELDVHLDSCYGSCWLHNPEVAGMVNATLLFYDGERYDMHHWCVMPNHVHAMFRVYPGFPLDKVIHSWKSFSANKANKLLGRSGDFFQHGYFDRMVRDEAHFYKTAKYIEENPVKAGLCTLAEEWEWSSAYARRQQRG